MSGLNYELICLSVMFDSGCIVNMNVQNVTMTKTIFVVISDFKNNFMI